MCEARLLRAGCIALYDCALLWFFSPFELEKECPTGEIHVQYCIRIKF